jgi:hypothetical protein
MTEDLTDESLENQQQRYTDEWRTTGVLGEANSRTRYTQERSMNASE